MALLEERAVSRKVLEVGSGKGYLLGILTGLGWDASGIDISKSAAEYSAATFGVSTFVGTLEEYVAGSSIEKYSVVLAIDLIEHVPHPDRFLAAAREVLVEDGLLIIDTPNAEAYNIGIQGVAWMGFNPFHIFLFSISCLDTLLRENGFEL